MIYVTNRRLILNAAECCIDQRITTDFKVSIQRAQKGDYVKWNNITSSTPAVCGLECIADAKLKNLRELRGYRRDYPKVSGLNR